MKDWFFSEKPPLKLHLVTKQLDQFIDPEQLFLRSFLDCNEAFWLDSCHPGFQNSRFSFMGTCDGPLGFSVQYNVNLNEIVLTDEIGIRRVPNMDAFAFCEHLFNKVECTTTDIPYSFSGGLVGYFGYEAKNNSIHFGSHQADTPDAAFLFAQRFIAFDLKEKKIFLNCLQLEDSNEHEVWFEHMERIISDPIFSLSKKGQYANKMEFELFSHQKNYLNKIEKCHKFIRSGESYQVCLTNSITTDRIENPFSLYRIQREINPAPYSSFLKFREFECLSSSPEQFLQIDKHGWVSSEPIKGTIRRGQNEIEDFKLKEELRNSIKDKAENLMIVDLVRNDFGRVCELGSVDVDQLLSIRSYATVHQMVSRIVGKLRKEYSISDCIKSCFPGGSMTGAPKLRTMDFIDQVEGRARGIYSGSLGYLSVCGSVELSIVIRTIVNTSSGASIGCGGAITTLSDPSSEFDEIMVKAAALMKAIMMYKSVNVENHSIIGLDVSDESTSVEFTKKIG